MEKLIDKKFSRTKRGVVIERKTATLTSPGRKLDLFRSGLVESRDAIEPWPEWQLRGR